MSNFEDWFKTVEDELEDVCDNQLDQYSAKEWLRDAFDEGKKYGRALGIQQMKRDSGWE